tara:strand:- start:18 stop:1016 length:999 start_codon:yes stop_codon:yes gene_type:complete
MALSKIPSAGFQDNIKFKNLIINGDMSIAQRGTSVTSTTDGYKTCDRWNFKRSVGVIDLAQSTDVPSGLGFANSYKVAVTSGATPSTNDRQYIEQHIEGQNLQYLKKGTSSAESLTVSFHIKSDVTGTYIVELEDTDNTRNFSQSYTISSADTWEKKTLTFAGDTSGAFDNDNAKSLTLRFYLSAGTAYTSGTLNTSWNSVTNANTAVGQVNFPATTNNELYLTGVQLEAGTTASDFEFLPTDINLNRCLRYYYQDTGYLDITVMRVSDSSRAVHKTLPVPMRTTPTFTSTSSNEIGNTSMNNSSDKSVRFSMSGSADNAPRYQAYNFSAEL